MKVFIGNDHGGYHLKLEIVKYLKSHSIPYYNAGSDSTDIVRYPYYAAEVAAAVSQIHGTRGILICSTGIGMSIAANRFKGIKAALCTDTYMAEMTRKHNDSNLLCLGGKIVTPETAMQIVDIWLHTDYIGGRHDISLNLLSDIETIASNDADTSALQAFIKQK